MAPTPKFSRNLITTTTFCYSTRPPILHPYNPLYNCALHRLYTTLRQNPTLCIIIIVSASSSASIQNRRCLLQPGNKLRQVPSGLGDLILKVSPYSTPTFSQRSVNPILPNLPCPWFSPLSPASVNTAGILPTTSPQSPAVHDERALARRRCVSVLQKIPARDARCHILLKSCFSDAGPFSFEAGLF